MDNQTMVLEDGREIILIHFAVRNGKGYKIACVPGLENFHAFNRGHPWHRTEEVKAVTCKVCKSTAEFKQARIDYDTAVGR